VFQLKARDETRKQAITDQAPTVSLDPGEERWVELEWDTDGLAFKDGKPDADHVLRVRAVLGHSIYSGRSVVLKVRPRPVVLVPGALEDASVWKTYAELLKRTNPEWEAHAVTGLDTGRWADLGHAPDTLDRHSEVLQAFVAGVRDEEDAEHVDLVAHGLGGIIARQWIQDGMPDGVVRHLIQLGTPNTGTPCAEVVDAGPFYDLRRDVMDGFNARVTERRGVEFSAYAGQVDPYTCVPGTEGGDMEVPVSSARWNVGDAETGEVSHVEMPASGAIFSVLVKPRLTG
jgi:triacylglycerol esterase/lipase EstA (alpha/beta hydrolase family)